VAGGIGEKLRQATAAAEVVIAPAEVGDMLRTGDRDRHAADRVDRLERFLEHGNLLRLRHAAPPQLDDLRHDAESDLLGRARADLEPRGRSDPVERFRRDAAREKRLAQVGEPDPAADQAEIGGREADRGLDRLQVALAHRRDEHVRSPRQALGGHLRQDALGVRIGRLVRLRIDDVDAIAHRVADAGEGACRERSPEEQQARRG
jgi:hypothetical protein